MNQKFNTVEMKNTSTQMKKSWLLVNLSKNTRKNTTEVKRNEGKRRYNSKRKKHVPIKPNTGYVAKTVRSFYSDSAETRMTIQHCQSSQTSITVIQRFS